jgi:hypothetical protein
VSALLLLLAASAAADPAPPPAAKPRVERAVRLSIHKEAKDWEPVSLKAGGDPKSSLTGATLRLRRSKGRLKGDPSRATAFARLHEAKDESWLVVTVVPKALARRRMQIELRFRVVEGDVPDLRQGGRLRDRREAVEVRAQRGLAQVGRVPGQRLGLRRRLLVCARAAMILSASADMTVRVR